jgi:hypothetical protein
MVVVAVSIFYVTYVIFEIPLTVLLKLVGPSRLSGCKFRAAFLEPEQLIISLEKFLL